MQTFLQKMTAHYVRVCNRIMTTYNDKDPKALKIELDEAQFEIDETVSHNLFTEAWNDAVRLLPPHTKITVYKEREWRWVLPHLIVACRQAFAAVIRVQFDDLGVDEGEYVPDSEDARHRYYCVGVVWRSVMMFFSNVDRIKDVVDSMFISAKEASAARLPVQEVNAKTYKSLLYASRSVYKHFCQVCENYRKVSVYECV